LPEPPAFLLASLGIFGSSVRNRPNGLPIPKAATLPLLGACGHRVAEIGVPSPEKKRYLCLPPKPFRDRGKNCSRGRDWAKLRGQLSVDGMLREAEKATTIRIQNYVYIYIYIYIEREREY